MGQRELNVGTFGQPATEEQIAKDPVLAHLEELREALTCRVAGVDMPPSALQLERRLFDKSEKLWAAFIFLKYWPGEVDRMKGLLEGQDRNEVWATLQAHRQLEEKKGVRRR